MNPPLGGDHCATWLSCRVFDTPQPKCNWVHNLEHGFIVAWYDSKLPASEVTKLQQLTTNPAFSRLLVVGWWQSDLPGGKHVVLTSWGRTDRCTSESDSVIRAFYDKHLNSKLSPEAGLPAIQGADSLPAGKLPPANSTPSMSPSPSASTTKK